MSNLGAFGGAKNPPWGRNNSPANLVNQNPNLQQQIISQGGFGGMNATGMVQLQQHQQVLQNAMNMQQQNINLGLQQLANTSVAVSAGLNQQIASNPLFQQVGAVAYPNPRALNPSAFQTQVVSAAAGVQTSNNSSTKQRVFTGTVTKVHDNFGFVDDDVFFQTNACAKGSNPVVGNRVLVEATFNPNMPFKWNATRMQVLPTASQNVNVTRGSNNPKGSNYNNMSQISDSNGGFGKGGQRTKGSMGGRGRERSRTRDEEEENERKRRKEDRIRERERDEKKSPLRRRSRSPKSRRRSRIVPRYMVQIPKICLDLRNADVLEVRRRYGNLYVPSDFFYSNFRWVDAFPPDKPFSINKPCSFHVMHKNVDALSENDTVLEPPDSDYLFSAKVMLMNVSGLEDMYQKCCALAEDSRRDDSEDRDYVHPTRLINFLVGVKGKSETMAIGGPWSKSLDGENPEKDPSVLIKTAIRTCKALTGIDLSPCTQWYRFVELYYRRAEAVHRGRTVPARVETVVLFLPDVWSCLPTRLEWDALIRGYQSQLENRIAAEGDDASSSAVAATADHEKEENVGGVGSNEKLEPTPYTDLDVKTMTVSALRSELKARSLSAKGLKSQLVARLQKALKSEAVKVEGGKDETTTEAESESAEDKKSEGDEKKIDEKERQQLEKRYALPEQPHIIVHPNRSAKSGKFDCTVMSLSLLLDYRPEDTKEHTFEVSLFAELFNEMLMRDFGFNIYKVLCELPEKVKEKEKEKDEKRKKKDEDKKKDDKEDKGDKKEEEKKKDKDDKKKDENEKKHREGKEKNEEIKEEKKKDSSKKEEKRSEKDEDSDDDDDYDEKRSDRDKKRKERLKMFTKDRNLLLSFTYFDQTHCGYIFEKDMEDLLFTLGLNLSRAQVRKLVGKVVSRDSLHYRKLTDKPKEDDFIVIDDSEKECNAHELAKGNKKYLPIFVTDDAPAKKQKIDSSLGNEMSIEEGYIMFRGAMVDVGKLMAQLERSEKARVATEACMVDLKSENARMSEKNSKHNSTIKSLNSEVKDYKDKLKHTEEVLSKISTCSKMFQTTLLDIRDKIDPVLKSAAHIKEEIKRERDGERERKHEESKSRWERNPKEREKEKDAKDKDLIVTVKEEKDKDKDNKGKEKEREKEKEKEKEKAKEIYENKEKEHEKSDVADELSIKDLEDLEAELLKDDDEEETKEQEVKNN